MALLGPLVVASGRRRAWVAPRVQTRRLSMRMASEDGVTWADLGLREDICRAAERVWAKPNLVQRASIGAVLRGEDVVIGAETGSGKTLSYLLPAIERIEPTENRRYPSVLVLVPNRELGVQLQRVARQLGADTTPPYGRGAKFSLGARHGGGVSLWPFRRGECPDVLVTTPSFMVNFDKDLQIWDSLRLVVLDEADALLDGGSKKMLDRILVALKRVDRARERLLETETPRCQRCVVAATLPTYGLKSVANLVDSHFDSATRVSGNDGAPLPMHAPVPTLRQTFLRVDGTLDEKLEAILGLVVSDERTMLFANTASAAQRASDFLEERGVRAAPYHKNVPPDARLKSLDQFALGHIDVLCCTDLAARGLDLPDVDHIVQLEFALDVVSHLHRVGRAARAGAQGRATNIYDAANLDLVAAISEDGSVEQGFSRRRGFRQKIKKQAKKEEKTTSI
ncbi:hypothetical protein CTAYLR_009006 [Chrysophaeum taylorii]|uniref:Uncharacterized protein n=1 Tax=Chrysophaeum taylorii TaxID=2483200 RepID=A0AAD7ULX7_9STRA|nr:hypothetical protein CTAYLR_009006 [Chrysophaeum taylorii]